LAADGSTTPPKNLKLVGDHWTPWTPPPAGQDAYLIQKGDTLWDLSGKWFNDPFLWPQIWDENRYILDSHWIYPGDPLVVPGRPTVVPTEGIPEVVGEVAVPTSSAPTEPIVAELPPPPPPPRLVPMADTTDLYCSGSIENEPPPPALWIAGRDTERRILGEGDVVFLSHGRDAGIEAGAEYGIVRRGRVVQHPATGKDLGTLVRRMGRLRVMLSHETSATAVITMSCEDLHEGDELLPWQEIPVPMLTELPAFDRWDPTPSGGATGQIVAMRDELTAVGDGNLIYTDLGAASGIAPGDIVTLFHARTDDLPRQNIGQAVVLTVSPVSSLVKITLAVRESGIGDAVEVR
jgi:hypothetical protein